jgi:DNA-binding response OmpR family regulator
VEPDEIMRILIVEDDQKLNNILQRGLAQEHYAVDQSFNGKDALEKGLLEQYDLIILDVALPGLNGLEVCRQLRKQRSQTSILMLTARDSVEDRVAGLDSGADDYLVKPFAFSELLARVRAMMRRTAGERSPQLRVADLCMDTLTREVHRGDDAVTLSAKEYAVLEYLMRNSGRVLTRQMIVEHAWDYSFDPMSNVIDVYIRYLRRKLDDGREPKLIHTVRGVGYQMKALASS